MKKQEIKINYTEFSSLNELEKPYRELIEAARKAAKKAYSPYSQFNVGAAVRLSSGKTVTGNNQENSSYPSGLCAERVALFYAHAQYPDQPIDCIAISAFKNGILVKETIKPCGGCRQVIAEIEYLFKDPITILLDGQNSILLFEGINQLLPFSFGKNH